jgi:hypothetical protein
MFLRHNEIPMKHQRRTLGNSSLCFLQNMTGIPAVLNSELLQGFNGKPIAHDSTK